MITIDIQFRHSQCSFHKMSRLLANKVKITTKATLSNDIVVMLNGVRSSAMFWLMLFHLYYIYLEYLYDLKEHHGEAEDCIIFALASITGRPILFHAIMENGAIFYRLPISAFIQKGYNVKEVPRMRLDELELWNCFSYYPGVTSFDHERTWWRLFHKRVVCTKFDIYV